MNSKKCVRKESAKLKLSELRPHPADPFKPYTEDKLKELAESIKQVGLLEPILVTKNEAGYYEILAGKNRANAMRLNGETEIQAFVITADEDAAKMILTDSNLKHRDKLLPSERGTAYKMQLEILKNTADAAKLAGEKLFSRIEKKSEPSDLVAQHHTISQAEVYRYIRLTLLIPDLLSLVDSGELSVHAGVNFSCLDEKSQQVVYDYFYKHKKEKMDMKKSERIKDYCKLGNAVKLTFKE